MVKKRFPTLEKSAKKVKIDFTKAFIKQHKKAPKKIQEAWEKRKNHQLTGEYKGHVSINITGDWRAIFTETLDEEDNKTILFKFLGTHNQLYG